MTTVCQLILKNNILDTKTFCQFLVLLFTDFPTNFTVIFDSADIFL